MSGKGQPMFARLKPLIHIPEDANDCWEWLGSINETTGYGKKQWGGRTVLSHRWVYEMFYGQIAKGLTVDHSCRNRGCCNPKHLETVTQAENVRRGAGTKLTREQAGEIKMAGLGREWGDGAKLARRYGVSAQLIHDIWHGRAWA